MLKIEKIKDKEEIMVGAQKSCPECGTYANCRVTGKPTRYQGHCCTCDCTKDGKPYWYQSQSC